MLNTGQVNMLKLSIIKDTASKWGFKIIFKVIQKKAKEFALKENDNIISFAANEFKHYSTYKYDKETNEFMIISRDGKIVTYFPPKDGIEYFYEQYERWGDHWN